MKSRRATMRLSVVESCLAILIMLSTQICVASAMAPAPGQSYDLVVIGGGSAGLTAAKLAATFDKSVVIIEANLMGGDCTWTGCVPSKSLLASAKAAHAVRTSSRFGIEAKHMQVDMRAIRKRIRDNMQRIYQEDDSPEAMTKLGIDTILGKATFVSPSEVMVVSSGEDKKTWTVKAQQGIVVCTGAKPKKPSIRGLEGVDYLTYEDIFNLDKVPKTLTVIGGGPIGCELSQAFCRLGSQVTQVASVLLPKEEPEVSQVLENVFESEGVVRVKGRLSSVASTKSGGHTGVCTLEDGSTVEVEGELLLIAAGRAPNVQGFGLEEIGVAFNSRGGIDTNQRLQTSVRNVYAAGDCTGDLQFTHYAGYQGAIAARNILLPLSDCGVIENVPSATFTSPEVSSIGLTEAQAKKEFGEDAVGVAFKRMKHVDRAICDGEENGFIKIVYSEKNYRIHGATVVSPGAGELISEIGVAIKAKMSFDQMATVIHSYPTYGIALQMMASDVNYEKTLKSMLLLDLLKKLGL